MSTLLTDKALFLYAFVCKEALVSSQIEGTRSTLSDLLLFEADEMPSVPIDDVRDTDVADAMADLEIFRIARDDGVPWLGRAALAHVQFETIHPFFDGNGRVGRLLIRPYGSPSSSRSTARASRARRVAALDPRSGSTRH